MHSAKAKMAIGRLLTFTILALSITELMLGNIGYDSNRHLLRFAYTGIDRVKGKDFADLRVVTENGHGCKVPTSQIYEKDCYWLSVPTNIPKTLIYVARILNIGEKSTNAAGIILGAALIASIGYTLVKTCGWNGGSVGITIILLSHSLRYTIERGNIDIIVFFCGLATSSLCAIYSNPEEEKQTKKPILEFAIGIIVATGTLMKVYAIFLLPAVACAFLRKNRLPLRASSNKSTDWMRVFSISQLAIIAGIVASFSIVMMDIPHMLSSSSNVISGGMSYGIKTLPNNDTIESVQYLVKLFFLGSGAYMCNADSSANDSKKDSLCFRHRKHGDIPLSIADFTWNSIKRHDYWLRLSSYMFISGSLIFVLSYLFFNNGNYRLFIFIALSMPTVVQFTRSRLVHIERLTGKAESVSYFMLKSISPIMFILLIATYNYRPYVSGVQHYTEVFWSFTILPALCGYLIQLLVGLFLCTPKQEG